MQLINHPGMLLTLIFTFQEKLSFSMELYSLEVYSNTEISDPCQVVLAPTRVESVSQYFPRYFIDLCKRRFSH